MAYTNILVAQVLMNDFSSKGMKTGELDKGHQQYFILKMEETHTK